MTKIISWLVTISQNLLGGPRFVRGMRSKLIT